MAFEDGREEDDAWMERSRAKSCRRPHSFRTGKGQGRQPMRGGEITAVFAEGARKISEEPHSGFETTVEMGTSRRRLWRDERIFQRRLCLRLSASHHGRCQVTSWHTAEAATASSHGSGKAVASRPCGNELNLNTAPVGETMTSALALPCRANH